MKIERIIESDRVSGAEEQELHKNKNSVEVNGIHREEDPINHDGVELFHYFSAFLLSHTCEDYVNKLSE